MDEQSRPTPVAEPVEEVRADDVPTADENVTVADLSDEEVAASDPQDVTAQPVQPEVVEDPEADQNAADAAEAQGETIDRGTFKPGQGNTNPADFDVFDEHGVFIEKRDR